MSETFELGLDWGPVESYTVVSIIHITTNQRVYSGRSQSTCWTVQRDRVALKYAKETTMSDTFQADFDWDNLEPLQIAAINTREALNRFWALPYIDEEYFGPPGNHNLTLYDTVAEIAKKIYPTPRKITVVDVGCGPGQGLAAIERAFPDYWLALYGIDWAETACERGRKLVPEAVFTCADILKETWVADDQADLVICLEMLEHQWEVQKTLTELLRVTKPGGHVLITVPNGAIDEFIGHRQFWPLDAFKELLADFNAFEVYYIRGETNLLGHLVK